MAQLHGENVTVIRVCVSEKCVSPFPKTSSAGKTGNLSCILFEGTTLRNDLIKLNKRTVSVAEKEELYDAGIISHLQRGPEEMVSWKIHSSIEECLSIITLHALVDVTEAMKSCQRQTS